MIGCWVYTDGYGLATFVPKEENSMEVKIDADELCRLKKIEAEADDGKYDVGRAMDQLLISLGFGKSTVLQDEATDFIKQKFDKLREQADEVYAAQSRGKIVHVDDIGWMTVESLQGLHAETDRLLSKMTKERDWWRGECFCLAENLNGRTLELDSLIARAQDARSGWIGDWVRLVKEKATRDDCSLD